MRKFFRIFTLLILAFSFTSCIELVEEIKINTDLSGEYHLYLKHNGLGFLFNSIGQNIDLSRLDDGLQKLEQQNGISNLKTNINPKKGKFSIQFDFSDDNSLNRAFYAALGVKKRFYHKNFLKISQSKIKRPNLTPYLVRYAKSQGLLDQLPDENILDYVKYRYRVISSENIKHAIPESYLSKKQEYDQLYPLKSLLLHRQSSKSIIYLEK
ncbi:MAG: hypothetical protein J7K39_04190 [Bacteroidales bacterium]|nr:hypothetical protein [Bacteroidales bacterium]